MRTVLTHFFNEAYLLPWWLEHHVRLFDHGVLVDHGSTDGSADICRRIAPHWRLVRSRLDRFDPCLTDFELMGFEEPLPGWKIVLTVTEFLLPARPLAEFERKLERAGRVGGAACGFVLADVEPQRLPQPGLPLVLQKHHGIDEGLERPAPERERLGLGSAPARLRAYHRLPIGMYAPGRRGTFHPDLGLPYADLVVLHCAYAPWNEDVLRRKLQTEARLSAGDLSGRAGASPVRGPEHWAGWHAALARAAQDLRQHPVAGPALARLADSLQPPPLT
jgi:hypothetical protein